MGIEQRELFAILIVFLLPLGMGQFVPKSTLPEYGAAVQMREAITGVADGQEQCLHAQCIVPSPEPHIAFAAALEKIYAAAMGLDAASPQAIVGFLLIFPPLLLAISSLALYLACRQLQYARTQSAFAALLFPLSLVALLSFLPGVYGSSQLAAFALALFLLPFAMFVHRPENKAALAAAALLALCTGYLNAAFAVAGLAAAVAFAFAHHGKFRRNLPAVAGEAHDTNKKVEGKRYLAMLGVLALAFGTGAALSPARPFFAFAPEGLAQIASGAPFLSAAASVCLGLFFFGRRDAEYFALVLLGAALFCLSPLAGAMLLVLPAAEGAARAAGEVSREAMLAGAFTCAFFAVLGFASASSPGSAYSAIAVGAMLGLLSPLLLHLYGYNAKGFFAAAGAALLLLSLFFAAFVQLPPAKAGYPIYTDPALAESLAYLADAGTGRLATLEREDAVGFYLPSATLQEKGSTVGYLLSGNASLAGGTRLLFSLPSLEKLSQKGGFEVYYYAQNYTSNGAAYALFVSQQGRLLSRELAAGGKFALKDGAALDSYGRYYAPVTLPRMVMLSPSKPIGDKANRLLVLEEGGVPPGVVALYSGSSGQGAKLEKEFGAVSVYRVG